MSSHSSSAVYTPVQHHASPSASTTPTRNAPNPGYTAPVPAPPPPPDFTSPSSYLNSDAYAHSEPNTPQGLSLLEMSYSHASATGSGAGSGSGGPSTSQPSFSQSTASTSHTLQSPLGMDGNYGFAYGDFQPYPNNAHDMDDNQDDFLPEHPHEYEHDQSTPSAPHRSDDDSTPVMSGHQIPLPAASLPHNPRLQPKPPLMSPFKAMTAEQHHHSLSESYAAPPPAYVDPSATFYAHQHQTQQQHSQMQPQYQQHPQHFQAHVRHHSHNPSPYYYSHDPSYPMPMAVAPQYMQPQSYPSQTFLPAHMNTSQDFGPIRSRKTSPTSSITSSVPSLARSGSTSSELRPRHKVKLSFEDKRNIVELHRTNSSLRQEDIARQYGVDRSTISKIILSAHRWTQQQEVQIAAAPKQPKVIGGRFPAIEERMHEWMDHQIASGLDVRDSVARDKAKAFAKEMNFPMDRFKASAKWLDKFKDRRKAAGKPTTSPMHLGFGYYPFTTAPYTGVPLHVTNPMGISRSQSALTVSSSDSSGQEVSQPSLQTPNPNPLGLTRSESNLASSETTPSRQRSQSSPQTIGNPGTVSPSSGKASRFNRPSPLTLVRQDSFHGTSPSPRRPIPLTRANSVQSSGSLRRSRPGSLAASAFGITPLNGDGDNYSPVNSPSAATTSGSSTHSRQRSEASLAPFMTSMSGMTLSPDLSESGGDRSRPNSRSAPGSTSSSAMRISIPPLTPITPLTVSSASTTSSISSSGQAQVHGVFPNTDYGVNMDHSIAMNMSMDMGMNMGMGTGMGMSMGPDLNQGMQGAPMGSSAYLPVHDHHPHNQAAAHPQAAAAVEYAAQHAQHGYPQHTYNPDQSQSHMHDRLHAHPSNSGHFSPYATMPSKHYAQMTYADGSGVAAGYHHAHAANGGGDFGPPTPVYSGAHSHAHAHAPMQAQQSQGGSYGA